MLESPSVLRLHNISLYTTLYSLADLWLALLISVVNNEFEQGYTITLWDLTFKPSEYIPSNEIGRWQPNSSLLVYILVVNSYDHAEPPFPLIFVQILHHQSLLQHPLKNFNLYSQQLWSLSDLYSFRDLPLLGLYIIFLFIEYTLRCLSLPLRGGSFEAFA